MSCGAVCPREGLQQDSESPGPIGDGEKIARVAADPTSGNKNTHNIKKSIVEKKALLTDQLSVWRLAGDAPRVNIVDLACFLRQKDPSKHYFGVVWASARAIRDIKIPATEDRVFCVVDECDCDRSGGKHPAHAHIAICKKIDARYRDADSPEFQQILNELAALFSNKARFAPMY